MIGWAYTHPISLIYFAVVGELWHFRAGDLLLQVLS